MLWPRVCCNEYSGKSGTGTVVCQLPCKSGSDDTGGIEEEQATALIAKRRIHLVQALLDFLEQMLNSIVTNDRFLLVRRGELQLAAWRCPRRRRT